MKTVKYIAAIAIACASLGLVPQANARIDLGQTAGNPADTDSVLARLQGQIDLYNGTHNPDLPDAVLAGNDRHDNQNGTSINLDVTGWTYLELKWDGSDQFYYVGDETGTQTFNSTVFNGNGQPQALSHYVFFNAVGINPHGTVPDGGATVMLLGTALGALGLARRSLKR